MVRIVAAQVVDVQGHQRVIDEALKKFMREIHVVLPDHATREFNMKLQPRPSGEIEYHARQGFIERHIGMPVAANALLVANRLHQRLADGDADVFDGMVRIDVQITLGLDFEINQAVPCNLIHHVIEKRHACFERRHSRAVEIELDADLCLVGVAGNFGGAHGG